jgi:hypothetical protein
MRDEGGDIVDRFLVEPATAEVGDQVWRSAQL